MQRKPSLFEMLWQGQSSDPLQKSSTAGTVISRVSNQKKRKRKLQKQARKLQRNK